MEIETVDDLGVVVDGTVEVTSAPVVDVTVEESVVTTVEDVISIVVDSTVGDSVVTTGIVDE